MHCKESEPIKYVIVQLTCTFKVSEGYTDHKYREYFYCKIHKKTPLKLTYKPSENKCALTSWVSKQGNFKAAGQSFGFNLPASLTYLAHKSKQIKIVWFRVFIVSQ